MNSSLCRRTILFATVFCSTAGLAFAQIEVNPYVGFYRTAGSGVGQLGNDMLFGARVAFHSDPNYATELNFAWIRNFAPAGVSTSATKGFLYEVAPTYTFSSVDWPVPSGFTPFLLMGFGGITNLTSPSPIVKQVFTPVQFLGLGNDTQVETFQITDHNTFFTVSAGGGIKSNEFLGPMGIRVDIRARLLPNYYGSTPIWLEGTVGLNFEFGGS